MAMPANMLQLQQGGLSQALVHVFANTRTRQLLGHVAGCRRFDTWACIFAVSSGLQLISYMKPSYIVLCTSANI